MNDITLNTEQLYPDVIPFDVIKSRAREMFEADLESALAYCERHRGDTVSKARMLFSFVYMVTGLIARPSEDDDTRLQQVREAGLRLIEHWDVRCVGQLVKHFPCCVPKFWQGAQLHCFTDDSSEQWLVSCSLQH